MNTKFFKELSKKFDLQLVQSKCIGSLELRLFIADELNRKKLKFFLCVALKIADKIRALEFFDFINHPFFGSYILSLYKKPL
jgi:hypothetical protein